MPTNAKLPLACWICGSPVSLESCVIDEHGMAVHEVCSVGNMISAGKGSMLESKQPPKPRHSTQRLTPAAAPRLVRLTPPHLNLAPHESVAFAGRLLKLCPLHNPHVPARVGNQSRLLQDARSHRHARPPRA